MSVVEKIQCPACGSNSTSKIEGHNYSCNYCHSNFMIKEEVKPKNNVDTFKEQIEEYRLTQQNNPALLRSIVIFISLIVFSIGGYVAFSISRGVESGNSTTSTNFWQNASIFSYKAFTGSKGAVAWIIQYQQGNRLDSVKYVLTIIDPKTTKVLKQVPFYKTITYQESFSLDKKVGTQFKQYNDIAYCYSEGQGFLGYDIYTFNVVVNTEILQKQFPELKNGIAGCEEMAYKKAYKLMTNTAEEFIYFPITNSLITKEVDDNAYKTDAHEKEQLYLSDGKKTGIYLIKSKVHGTRDELTVSNSLVEELEKDDNSWYKRSYGIIDFKSINTTAYFKAFPFIRTNTNIIFMYTPTLALTAPITIESVDNTGKTTWQLKDTILKAINNFANYDHLYCDYTANERELIINSANAHAKSISIDLITGKINWVIDPEKMKFN
jgi:DNA-directed RNA polymerase subunit RPC12/RpoP